jgi:triphosphoribosyl-dephospho-CoA synthase
LGEAPSALLPDLLKWDAWLKQRGINPGTSADLTVATLFAHRLRTILPSARNSD